MSGTITPIKVTLGDGSVVEGANLEEAFTRLQEMKVNTHNALKNEKTLREAAEQESARLRQEAAAFKAPPKKVEAGQFDNDKYFALLNNDPVAANDYYFEYRFGRTPEAFNNEYQAVSQKVSSFEQQTVAAYFVQSHQDFPQTPEAVAALTDKTKLLMAEGHPYNVRTVELAYQESVKEGRIKPIETKQEEVETPNPSLRGAGASGSEEAELQRFSKMTTTEQESYLRSKGMI